MPDTSATFHAGYAVATVLYIAYIVSLAVRGRRLRQRIDALRRARR
ncbi:MAG TPA: hypothetical protein VHV78_00365 [Gemmatimonadaceae bacterium]|jgi:hypothetical protein|nr:hypothetical protein [Gemmatimonadaceae bacterium]